MDYEYICYIPASHVLSSDISLILKRTFDIKADFRSSIAIIPSIFILAILSRYWAALFHAEAILSSSNFDPMAMRQAIYDEKVWAAVVINLTALLQDAVTNRNASYDLIGAAQII